tara:strand:+ start:203 stop:325 length:123 start_codon:yes stop_codon:yes gene_type:complete
MLIAFGNTNTLRMSPALRGRVLLRAIDPIKGATHLLKETD